MSKAGVRYPCNRTYSKLNQAHASSYLKSYITPRKRFRNSGSVPIRPVQRPCRVLCTRPGD
eukprot:1540053-Pyramimonas_sp.AAC.1